MSWEKIRKTLTSTTAMIYYAAILAIIVILFGAIISTSHESRNDFSYEIKEVELSDGSYVNCLITRNGNDHTMECDWMHRTIKGKNYEQ